MNVLKAPLCVFALTLALAHPQAAEAATAAEAFQRIKALAGDWTITGDEPGAASYELVAGGSVVLERFHGMLTTYALDGETIVAVHYCAVGNQPRLVATSFPDVDGGVEMTFDVTSVGNLPHPGAGHMARLVMTLGAPDAFEQRWTWRQDGRDAAAHQIRFQRKAR